MGGHRPPLRLTARLRPPRGQVLAASGYAFEYVQPNERTWSPYFAMLWRLNACTGFTHPEDKPAVLWGGAMMFRSKELKRNIYGITDAWRDGGYSEDFITLSLTRYHGRKIACPKTALFPNRLGSVEFGRFWNFLCRQIYVLMQVRWRGYDSTQEEPQRRPPPGEPPGSPNAPGPRSELTAGSRPPVATADVRLRVAALHLARVGRDQRHNARLHLLRHPRLLRPLALLCEPSRARWSAHPARAAAAAAHAVGLFGPLRLGIDAPAPAHQRRPQPARRRRRRRMARRRGRLRVSSSGAAVHCARLLAHHPPLCMGGQARPPLVCQLV